MTDPRFNVDLDKSTSTYTLRIEDIQETDGATYQCQVIIALTDKEQADVPLIVRRPPIISGILTNIENPRNIRVCLRLWFYFTKSYVILFTLGASK